MAKQRTLPELIEKLTWFNDVEKTKEILRRLAAGTSNKTHLEAGNNIGISGEGTEEDPFIISANDGGAGAVDSVFGRTGTVTAQTGDYNVSQITGAQGTLVSGTNIKTVNGETLIGSGNIEIDATTAWNELKGDQKDVNLVGFTDGQSYFNEPTNHPIELGSEGFRHIVYGKGVYIALTTTYNVYLSTDGIIWDKFEPLQQIINYTGVGFDGERFILTGFKTSPNSAIQASSTDGISWTQDSQSGLPTNGLRFLSYNNGIWMGISGSSSYRSVDGINWTGVNTNSQTQSLTYGNGVWVIFSGNENGQSLRSSTDNGLSWSYSYIVDQDEYAFYGLVTFSQGIFYAISEQFHNPNLYSYNGIDWLNLDSVTEIATYSLIEINGDRYLISKDKPILTTSDGINWVNSELQFTIDYKRAFKLNDKILFTGDIVNSIATSEFNHTKFENIVNEYQVNGIPINPVNKVLNIEIPESVNIDITAGTNISIDKTDPLKPVINASGGAGETYTAGDNITISPTNEISATNTTYSVFSTGNEGLVPARVGAVTTKYLREDGTWVTPTNTTYTAATKATLDTGTSETAGIISPLILKQHLDGKGYSTQTLTAGTNITIDGSGVISATGGGTWGTISGTLSNQTDLNNALNSKVGTSGNETIAGVKTFSSSPIVPAPTTNMQAATKKYVDDSVSGAGGGDMLKSVYDTNNNGVVDNAALVNGLSVETAVPSGALFTDTTYSVFSTGNEGLVPARVGSVATKYLREDGTWVVPTNTTYTAVTKANLDTGASTTAGTVSPLVLKQHLDGKGYLTTFTETDPTVPTYAKSLTDFNIIKTSTDALYEPIIVTKNSGFNRVFGTAANTVAQGNDSRINNGQTAFDSITSLLPIETSNTNSTIALTTSGGNLCNMGSANTNTTYTTTGTVLNAYAKVLINTVTEPTVTGATKIKGATWTTGADMYMIVNYTGSARGVEYYFLEI